MEKDVTDFIVAFLNLFFFWTILVILIIAMPLPKIVKTFIIVLGWIIMAFLIMDTILGPTTGGMW